MALALRLGGRKFQSYILSSERPCMFALSRSVTLRSVAPPPPITEGHDEHNMKLARPLSPHLTIYSLQLTSILSISHRITGMALGGTTILFGLASFTFNHPFEHYIQSLESMSICAPVVFLGKVILGVPFAFHFVNGIRHLLWDAGKFLSIKEVYATGYIMLLLTGLLSLALLAK